MNFLRFSGRLFHGAPLYLISVLKFSRKNLDRHATFSRFSAVGPRRVTYEHSSALIGYYQKRVSDIREKYPAKAISINSFSKERFRLQVSKGFRNCKPFLPSSSLSIRAFLCICRVIHTFF